jgi:lipopolysaccharide cholinephosphotransferase
MQCIDIEQCHNILLDIAKNIDKLCRENGIPYYMLAGTMLGAVRHKGFIPWDDDLDFGIPREYYDKFLQVATQSFPPHLKVSTYQNDNRVVYGVAKIQDIRTLIHDPRSMHSLEEQLGINVDVFPLDYCGKLEIRHYLILFLIRIQTLLFVESTVSTHTKTLIRMILRNFLCVKSSYFPKKIDKLIKNLSNNNDNLGSFWSGYGTKHIMSVNVWGKSTEYTFEDTRFFGIEDYDTYLSTLMGNYMKLPEKHKRIVHCEHIYLKENI